MISNEDAKLYAKLREEQPEGLIRANKEEQENFEKWLKVVRCMKVEFSKAFIKASKRLSGKMLDSLRHMIVEVKEGKAWLGCGALLG